LFCSSDCETIGILEDENDDEDDSSNSEFGLNWHNCDHMDIQLGYALLRDRRVPIRPKLIALAIGAAVVGFTGLLQIPLESLFAVILPIVGIAGDVVLDGVEAVFGPLLIATLLLPYLAPDPVVQQIRAERARPV
jgi:hypothetical protein